MKRNSMTLMGALHPVLFLLLIYVISIVLAFFVCTTVYNSLHSGSPLSGKAGSKVETLTLLK